MEHYFESNYKKLGIIQIGQHNVEMVNSDHYKPYIKILYLPVDYKLTVDFRKFTTKENSLFFINSNQYFQLQKAGTDKGYFIYYNRDFYCVQIHDAEVACDGLLFNNIYEISMTIPSTAEDPIIAGTLEAIHLELAGQESSKEEMVRTYLKQIIIRATRIWKKQNLGALNSRPPQEIEFFRNFSRLVEIHFRNKHAVADYAELLALAPKTLSKKLSRMQVTNPNDRIKDRIVLEAKRLLIYSDLNVKEIAYQLGYDDPAYFNRLFRNKTKHTPAGFRKHFNQ